MHKDTKLISALQDNAENKGHVNGPIYQASTLIFENVAELKNAKQQYGRTGTQTVAALEDEVANLEQGHKALIYPSGLAAITSALLAFLKPQDEIVIIKQAYEPTREFCDNYLAQKNIKITYCPSDIGANIGDYISAQTKIIYLESPASITFQIQDIAAIVKIAKQKNILVFFDNTWSASHCFKPIEHGADISIQALTKYPVGHSDVLLGSVTCKNAEQYKILFAQYKLFGTHVSSQDCYIASRGLKTLAVRLQKHGENAQKLAKYLQQRDEVEQVIAPFVSSHPQYKLWQKYFTKAQGLISFTLKKDFQSEAKIHKFIDSLKLFHLGYSWGGYESLVMFYEFKQGNEIIGDNQYLIRLHVGLEDAADLEADLNDAFREIS